MSNYRLHIDIPLGTSEEEAIQIASQMVSTINTHVRDRAFIDPVIEGMNWRLGHDDDRQKSNYLDINENGHVTNKKCSVKYGPSATEVNQQTFDFVPSEEC